MHELSVATALIELVEEAVRGQPPGRVEVVRVRLGRMSGVVGPALASAFAAAARGSAAAEARLAIEVVEPAAWCDACAAERELPVTAGGTHAMRCPSCAAPVTRLTRGRELELFSLEVTDAAEDRPGPPADPEEQ